MSMVLFALCTHPLLKLLDKNITGIRLGRSGQRTAVVAYADDLTVFVTKPEYFTIRQAIHLYEKASGVCLNMRKSTALATGGFEGTANDLGKKFH